MQLKRLSLTQFRAFEQATFEFYTGMNLLVGVNNVGKSTVLDALRMMLSQILPKLTASKSKTISFEPTDIMSDRGAFTVELQLEAASMTFNYLVHEPRQKYVVDQGRTGEVRDQTFENPERHDLTFNEKSIPRQLKKADEQPLAVYYSPRRSIADFNKQSKTGGQAAAFDDALNHRELRLLEFANWWIAQKALAKELPVAQRHLNVLEEAVIHFLDTCSNLHAQRETETYKHKDKAGNERTIQESNTSLLLNKAGVTLNVHQLSDGERGILALVLDLAKRLSQANPGLDNPLHDGKAVVLIDELDLHLHPRWQRTIIDKLTHTFPNCQFIATTHSPQIIGEVAPESIIMIESGHPPYRPDQSLGMDTNWVLRYLMNTPERDAETKQKLASIADLIENEQYDKATEAIYTLRQQVGEFTELVRLQTRIDRIRLLGE
jgi:predicted ATP-binding protein involved in virulence